MIIFALMTIVIWSKTNMITHYVVLANGQQLQATIGIAPVTKFVSMKVIQHYTATYSCLHEMNGQTSLLRELKNY